MSNKQEQRDYSAYAFYHLEKHFGKFDIDDLVSSNRQFSSGLRADLQIAINNHYRNSRQIIKFSGINEKSHYETVTFPSLFERSNRSIQLSPVQYEEVDIGEYKPVKCLLNGLWLLKNGNFNYAFLLSRAVRHGQVEGMHVEIIVTAGDKGAKLTDNIFGELEKAVNHAKSYRGKILSLENSHYYGGISSGIKVHRIDGVSKKDIILPKKTLDLIERNVINFVKQRDRLKKYNLSVKKGILCYGPPGTGKTYTIKYLASVLKDHTTFLINAEQVGLLEEYISLARLLQPSIVVIEDADLIARERESMGTVCEEVLLNRLLNEMDGLTEDAEILFILTTNRPESLEAALSSRPGRVDQSIEFPLPDKNNRIKLIKLYSKGFKISKDVIETVANKTKNMSAAFIKELMRRAVQFNFETNNSRTITVRNVEDALEEMLFSGGKLNVKLLGGQVDQIH